MKDSKGKNREVFVVTRNGRRVEHQNYFSEEAAKNRVKSLRKMLKMWRDPDLQKVEVVKTSRPHKVW